MVVKELRGQFPFSMLLEIAGISKQIYYYEINHLNDKNEKDSFYEKMILEIFRKNYEKYGVPRMTIAINQRLKVLICPLLIIKRLND